jgi:hypothetical protein
VTQSLLDLNFFHTIHNKHHLPNCHYLLQSHPVTSLGAFQHDKRGFDLSLAEDFHVNESMNIEEEGANFAVCLKACAALFVELLSS